MKVINVGYYPPPYGGVSVHLKRLKEYMDSEGLENDLIDISNVQTKEKQEKGITVTSFKKVIFELLFTRRSLIHFHSFSFLSCIVYFILGFRHSIILSFHNERFLDDIKEYPPIVQKVLILLLNEVKYIIVDSEKCFKLAKTIIKDEKKISIIPEFIPPLLIPEINEEDKIMQLRKNCKYLISSSAFKISFYKGEDLYGIDLMVELVHRLRKSGIDAAMCLLLPDIGDKAYYEKIITQIEEYGLKEKIFIRTTPLEVGSSLYKISDIVLRTTNTDGNALTILEAVSVGTPVIASDCVTRSQEVILFKTRDIEDLFEKTKMVLFNLEAEKTKLLTARVKNNAYEFIDLYNRIIKDNNKA